ncbi:MAG: PEP-CTERM sorting domain-containing protein [Planctomycetota bacterium]
MTARPHALAPVLALAVASAAGLTHASFTTVINVPPDIGDSLVIGSDTQVNLSAGGTIGSLIEVSLANGTGTNAELNVSGGTTGFGDVYAGGTVNVTGGDIGSEWTVRPGGVINVSGGRVGSFTGLDGGTMNLSSGRVEGVSVNANGVFNMTGGLIEFVLGVAAGGVANVSGGSLEFPTGLASPAPTQAFVTVTDGGTLNLNVTQLSFNGADFTNNLQPGVITPIDVANSQGALAGTLLDGTTFEFDLSNPFSNTEDYIDPNATLNVTLAGVLGDFDRDDDVDADDIDIFLQNVGNRAFDISNDGVTDEADALLLINTILGTFLGDANLNGSVGTDDLAILAGNFNQSPRGWATADITGDGTVGTGDLAILAANFGQGTPPLESTAAAVPEPASLALLGLGGLLVARRRP